jgi:nicotinate-nucleotide pyrophosphorylase (carboxylating)
MARAERPRLSDRLLAAVDGNRLGVVSATEPGVIAGLELLDPGIAEGDAGSWTLRVGEGAAVDPGQPIVEVCGSAAELAVAEDYVLGLIGWASGVATRCRQIVARAPDGLRVVCGGWKKLPAPLKPLLRAGLAAGGVGPRLLDGRFLYIDKNAVRLLGGAAEAVAAGRALEHGPVAVQARSAEAAVAAARDGAGVVMVDSASLEVLREVQRALEREGIRDRVVLAFGGGVQPTRLAEVAAVGAEVVDIGREILDAPLLDLRFDVISEEAGA